MTFFQKSTIFFIICMISFGFLSVVFSQGIYLYFDKSPEIQFAVDEIEKSLAARSFYVHKTGFDEFEKDTGRDRIVLFTLSNK
ncbi:hypothetical protein JW935_18125, partial [candidate division KSB1 bacterium]|nr:hypothetical protein [candidate division KSB1 bacterium]